MGGSRFARLSEAAGYQRGYQLLACLVLFRLFNAYQVRTFFQPDEYFQSLEPAWQIAFGEDSGAWITWEWTYKLRSAIHPAIFASVYSLAAAIAQALRSSPALQAQILLYAPKIFQALLAALVDLCTWQLAKLLFGNDDARTSAVLLLSISSPWHWFCSTRTFSNCLETLLTIRALTLWPWEWSKQFKQDPVHIQVDINVDSSTESTRTAVGPSGNVGDGTLLQRQTARIGTRVQALKESYQIEPKLHEGTKTLDCQGELQRTNTLKQCLVFAAFACILRPTNIMIWICLTLGVLFPSNVKRSTKSPFSLWSGSTWSGKENTSCEILERARRIMTLFKQGLLCGSFVVLISLAADSAYYRTLTFPPYSFLYFNLAKNLAVFYGSNRIDYYLTEAFPLLLTTVLPFAIIGIYQALFSLTVVNSSSHKTLVWSPSISRQLATICIAVPSILSMIAHKEVRFIYPLLPPLYILAATPFVNFYCNNASRQEPLHHVNIRFLSMKPLFHTMLAINFAIALFATRFHQPAPISVMTYLRRQYISQHLPSTSTSWKDHPIYEMKVGFLMPCHSTPWRSHLIFPGIKAWALSCEPPITLTRSERVSYRDEADQFYDDTRGFLPRVMGPFVHPNPFHADHSTNNQTSEDLHADTEEKALTWPKVVDKMWPEYLVFFEEREPILRETIVVYGYRECWRGWNSWFHDDWRRTGDIVVWCLDGA